MKCRFSESLESELADYYIICPDINLINCTHTTKHKKVFYLLHFTDIICGVFFHFSLLRHSVKPENTFFIPASAHMFDENEDQRELRRTVSTIGGIYEECRWSVPEAERFLRDCHRHRLILDGME